MAKTTYKSMFGAPSLPSTLCACKIGCVIQKTSLTLSFCRNGTARVTYEARITEDSGNIVHESETTQHLDIGEKCKPVLVNEEIF